MMETSTQAMRFLVRGGTIIDQIAPVMRNQLFGEMINRGEAGAGEALQVTRVVLALSASTLMDTLGNDPAYDGVDLDAVFGAEMIEGYDAIAARDVAMNLALSRCVISGQRRGLPDEEDWQIVVRASLMIRWRETKQAIVMMERAERKAVRL